jgi:CO/xanthine dehydrogenase Mo-binding subunit
VRVHRATGVIETVRYVCAHDVGLIINPDTLRHVIDRQLVYGTSRTMFEEVRFHESMVTSVDWQTYPVLRTDRSALRTCDSSIARSQTRPD